MIKNKFASLFFAKPVPCRIKNAINFHDIFCETISILIVIKKGKLKPKNFEKN